MGRDTRNRPQSSLLDHARAMRKSPTPAERMLWQALRNRALGPEFRRQMPIGHYIVDFFCPAYRLVIEVDGETHALPTTDATRDAWLRAQGLHVVRFWNHDVTGNLAGVLATIAPLLQPPL